MPLTIEATTGVIDVVPAADERGTLRRQVREYCSLVFSAALHTGVLLVMAFCAIPTTRSRNLDLNAVFNEEPEVSEDFFSRADVALQFPVVPDVSVPTAETIRELPDLDIAMIRADLRATVQSRPAPTSTMSTGTPAAPSRVASSIEEAVDHVAGRIEDGLQEGDLLVVWLVDASPSFAGQRQRLASRLGTFLPRFAGGAGSHHPLLHAVVSFGAEANEQLAPTEFRDAVFDSVRELPVDASGKEIAFAAIEQCVAMYRSRWRDRQLMIVVWTDESGDDASRLEDTIRICRDQGVSVSVVGPSAVLGADQGTYPFSDPQSHRVRQLSVRRGPDTPLPERLALGYWFLTREPRRESGLGRRFGVMDLPSWYGHNRRIPGYRCVAATEGALPCWYGGPDLKGLASGFSPYALTRLAMQTGGSYTILDRDDRGGPFLADAMREYLPDYRSLEEYLHDVQSHPLRRAVMEAVKVTQNKQLGPPPTMLFGKWSESPPYGFMRAYFTPAGFASHLTGSCPRLKAQADRTTRIVEQALACVSESDSVEDPLEDAYQRETSRRWRAWYDLTRGRLLATSVRLEEYRLTCDLVVEPGFLKKTTNHLILGPARRMKFDSRFRSRAAEAERLLVRCVRDNPKTPWALLAQRELDYGLGIHVRQHAIALVVMPPSMTRNVRPPRF